MKFVFLDQWGGRINLKVNLEKIVDINAGIDWKVEGTDTLIISSPKYIGYQMSRIIDKGHGLEGIEYATKVDLNGNWQYEEVDPRLQSLMRDFMPAANAVPAEPL